MSTIRRRLTFWYTVALRRDGPGLRDHCCTSSGASVQPAGAGPAAAARGRSGRSLAQRVVQRAGPDRHAPPAASPTLDPGISAYLEAVRDYLDRRGHRRARCSRSRTRRATLPRRRPPACSTAAARHARDCRSASGTVRPRPAASAPLRYLAVRVGGRGARGRRRARRRLARARSRSARPSCFAPCC